MNNRYRVAIEFESIDCIVEGGEVGRMQEVDSNYRDTIFAVYLTLLFGMVGRCFNTRGPLLQAIMTNQVFLARELQLQI